MSERVGKPEDRLPHDAAHIIGKCAFGDSHKMFFVSSRKWHLYIPIKEE